MNLRKKITLASVLMILIPIIVSAILSIVVLVFRGSGSLNRMKELYDDDNGLLNVQTILYNHKKEMMDYVPTEEYLSYLKEKNGDWEDDWDDEDDDWENDGWGDWDDEEENISEEEQLRQTAAFGALIKELRAIGYSSEIRYDHQVILSNLPEDAEQEIAALAGAGYTGVSGFSLTSEEASVVKRTYAEEGKVISVLAFCDDYVSDSASSQILREFVTILGIFAVILLVAVAISIFLLTSWLSGGMKKSLSALSEGVRQIQDGNLGYRIRSRKKDELGKACQEFDEMAEYLENSVKQREQYEEARKQMLAGISHDLRTPLTSIKAYVEGLRDGIANTEEKKQRYYEAIKIRTGDLEALIDNLSLFSRFDRKAYDFSMEKIDFVDFLLALFRENEIECKENQVEIIREKWPHEPLYIQGDRKQLKRVLGNLIDNAVKYRDTPKTLLKVALTSTVPNLYLVIEDNGPGVPEEEREKIFDTFFRGDQARQNPGNGSGLGLSIVREIVKGHGGTIRAEEGRNGRGLKMIIELPLEQEYIKQEDLTGDRNR